MKVVILLIVLSVSCVLGQGYTTVATSFNELVLPSKNRMFLMDSQARECSYTVSCTKECNIYFMTWDNYQLFLSGGAFQPINSEKTYSMFTYGNQQVIAGKVVVLVTNPSADSSVYASATIQQDQPGPYVGGIVLIIIYIVIGSIGCCCCCCCVLCCVGACSIAIHAICKKDSSTSDYRYVHLSPDQHGDKGGQGVQPQGVFTQGYTSNQYPQPNYVIPQGQQPQQWGPDTQPQGQQQWQGQQQPMQQPQQWQQTPIQQQGPPTSDPNSMYVPPTIQQQ
jgi:hypothetical protein